jgi:peptide deformylase
MTIKNIRLFGDSVLTKKADEVKDFDKEIRQLVKDLTETMLEAPGVGLAAPQIGVSLRVFTYNVEEDRPGHLINPILQLSENRQDGDEGCLSIPGLAFNTDRSYGVIARGKNMYGEDVVIEGSELLARCIQHETDHLDGILFVDRLDTETRKLAMKSIREAEWFGLDSVCRFRFDEDSIFRHSRKCRADSEKVDFNKSRSSRSSNSAGKKKWSRS